MRISDWSSDVCSSDLKVIGDHAVVALWFGQVCTRDGAEGTMGDMAIFGKGDRRRVGRFGLSGRNGAAVCGCGLNRGRGGGRSEEHTSELQSLMRSSYAVFCLKKKKTKITNARQQE